MEFLFIYFDIKMILSIENNHQTIKVLSSNPSQDQFGVWIPPPQVLANSQK